MNTNNVQDSQATLAWKAFINDSEEEYTRRQRLTDAPNLPLWSSLRTLEYHVKNKIAKILKEGGELPEDTTVLHTYLERISRGDEFLYEIVDELREQVMQNIEYLSC
jgi:hypothetical protein